MDGPKYAVIYRWRIRPEKEEQFIQDWSRVTLFYVKSHGALGARLHRGPDDIWYAYAQWPDLETRNRAFAEAGEPESHAHINDAIIETFPEIVLSPVADFLILPSGA
jgi:hypothetical protein